MSDLAVKASEPVALSARLNEDWLAVVIGLAVFALALFSDSDEVHASRWVAMRILSRVFSHISQRRI